MTDTKSHKTGKRLYIVTYGCQMNVRDSEFVTGLLVRDGFDKAHSPENADIVLFNSCSVRKHAEDRLFNNIWQLKKLKNKNPGLVIGVIGCTAQSYKEKLLEEMPLVDFVCGPGNESDLPRILKDIIKNRCPIVAIDKINAKRPEIKTEYRDGKDRTFVSISEGCDNFCSYCIVPYVRGRERSRAEKDIIKEVKELADHGFREITLLGQNVNSYGKVTMSQSHHVTGFVKLLGRLNAIRGIERIRFMTSHPKDASASLFKAMGTLEKVDKRLHLPLQSGSNRILKLMNRGYTREKYLKLAELFRKNVAGGSLTTDIIVGFPSETRNDFNQTLEVIKKSAFEGGFVFKYSPRPPAKASLFKDDVPTKEKEKRHAEALKALKKGALCLFVFLSLCLFSPDVHARAAVESLAEVEKLFMEAKYDRVVTGSDKLIEAGTHGREELYYLKGLSLAQLGRFSEARSTFEYIIDRYPRGKRVFDAYAGIGDAYFLEGKFNEAIAAYQGVLEKFPDHKNSSVISYKIGSSYQKLGISNKADEYFNRVKKDAPLSFESKMIQKGTEKEIKEVFTGDYYYVQVGYFKTKANADKLNEKLRRAGYGSYISTSLKSNTAFYRVKVGRFKSKAEAEAMARRLKEDRYLVKVCR